MVSAEESEQDANASTLRMVVEKMLAAYNVDDVEQRRPFYDPECVGFDHRRLGLGRFQAKDLLAYLSGLSVAVRAVT